MRSIGLRILLAVTGVFVLGSASVLPVVLDPRPLCQQADSWIEAHADSLPRTLEELSAYPVTYRVRIYSQLTAEEKSAIWHQQLTEALARTDLNEEQRQFIRSALPLLTARRFAAKERTPELEARAKELFVTHEHADIFIQIGPLSQAEG